MDVRASAQSRDEVNVSQKVTLRPGLRALRTLRETHPNPPPLEMSLAKGAKGAKAKGRLAHAVSS